jgi:dihydrofolate reductase
MRKIVNSTYVSLDGVIENPQNWHKFGDEATELAQHLLFSSDALLMGRVTYEGFAEAWQSREGEFADRFNNMKKYVVSSSLDKAEWTNTTIIPRETAVAELTRLKAEPGQNILQYGVGPVTHTLLRHGLLDELVLWLNPVLVGTHGPDGLLYADGFAGSFELLDAKPYKDGVVILTYRPVTDD